MQKDNFSAISEMVITLFEAKLKSYSDKTIEVWVRLLIGTGLEEGDIRVAITNCIYSPDDFPTIGKLIASIKPDTKLSAENEWQKVMEHIRRRGSHVPIEDASLAQAVRAVGGLVALGNCDDEQIDFKRREFLERYERIAEKNPLISFEEKNKKHLTG